jgi:lysophospholipase L1-like esterase
LQSPLGGSHVRIVGGVGVLLLTSGDGSTENALRETQAFIDGANVYLATGSNDIIRLGQASEVDLDQLQGRINLEFERLRSVLGDAGAKSVAIFEIPALEKLPCFVEYPSIQERIGVTRAAFNRLCARKADDLCWTTLKLQLPEAYFVETERDGIHPDGSGALHLADALTKAITLD